MPPDWLREQEEMRVRARLADALRRANVARVAASSAQDEAKALQERLNRLAPPVTLRVSRRRDKGRDAR